MMRSIRDVLDGMMKPKPRTRKTAPNPAWKRMTRKDRRNAETGEMKIAADPVPMTRQVERQNARRMHKMPLGVKQADWHRHIGLTVSKRMKARADRGIG